MIRRMQRAARLWVEQGGISSVEYAMLLALVAGGIILAAEFLSGAVSNQMNETAECFDGTKSADGGEGSGSGGGGDNDTGQGADTGQGFVGC